MLWGMLLQTVDLKFEEVHGNLNATKYIKILKDNLLPTMKSLYDDDWLLQEDNTSLHTSMKTQQFLGSKSNIILGWPPKSPELSVIENCWHILAQHLHINGAANNLTDLRRKINDAISTVNRKPNTGLGIYRSSGSRIVHNYLLKKNIE